MDGFSGKVAAVTGAASGIGRAVALRLVAEGASVAVCDVDATGLAETARLIKLRGGRAMQSEVDVSDVAAVRAFAAAVRDEFGVVHQIYNNAGIAFVGPIEDVGYGDMRHVIDVNFWGVVYGTKEFLPYLIESGAGHVVNVSSLFGLAAAPWLAGYDASKFAVRGFTEALRGEMIARKRPVKVTCVHPGGIRTPIVRHADATPDEDLGAVERGFRRVAMSSADGAARAILRGVSRGRARVLIGPDAYGADAALRLTGAAYERLAGLAARVFLARR